MKKMIMTVALMCTIVLSSRAQVYGYDQALKLPTVDLYDDALMEMELRAARETAARRQKAFEHFGDLAYDAYLNKRWVDVINNVNSALNTGYYNGKLYYFRGFAYESLGYYKNAKKDYKVAKKKGVFEANAALVAVFGFVTFKTIIFTCFDRKFYFFFRNSFVGRGVNKA